MVLATNNENDSQNPHTFFCISEKPDQNHIDERTAKDAEK